MNFSEQNYSATLMEASPASIASAIIMIIFTIIISISLVDHIIKIASIKSVPYKLDEFEDPSHRSAMIFSPFDVELISDLTPKVRNETYIEFAWNLKTTPKSNCILKGYQVGLQFDLLFIKEVLILHYFKGSRYIVNMLGILNGSKKKIVLDYFSIGTLSRFILKKRLSKRSGLTILIDVSKGLQLIHTAGIVHSDLKTTNILLIKHKSRINAILFDFECCLATNYCKIPGISSVRESYQLPNTKYYASPEILNNRRRFLKAFSRDIYSFSFIIFEVLTHSRPWSNVPKISKSFDNLTFDDN